VPGHQFDGSFADEIGMFDGSNAGNQSSSNSFIGLSVRHDVGAPALCLFYNRVQFFQ
jgi:hypothetical protein